MPVRFGLIGAGVAAELHAAAMRMLPEVQAVAVADVDFARAKTLAERYNIPGVFKSTRALLAGAAAENWSRHGADYDGPSRSSPAACRSA